MPARSKAQQEAMAIEYEKRKSGQGGGRFASMGIDQLRDFAQTPRTGLPERVTVKVPKPGANAGRGGTPVQRRSNLYGKTTGAGAMNRVTRANATLKRKYPGG